MQILYYNMSIGKVRDSEAQELLKELIQFLEGKFKKIDENFESVNKRLICLEMDTRSIKRDTEIIPKIHTMQEDKLTFILY